MAVEKLILRSILYGADKIPDSWFEKLPGGYYKDAQGNTHKIGEKKDKKDRSASKQEGRKAEHTDFYPERHSSERGRQRRKDRGRSRSSYDGGADEDFYHYSEDGRPHRSDSHRRRRSVDGNKYGYDDDHRRGRRHDREMRPSEPYHDDRHRGVPSPNSRDPDYGRRRSAAYIDRRATRSERPPFDSGAYAAPAAVGVGRAVTEPTYPPRQYPTQLPSPTSPPTSRNGPISNGYVPYAHIYGNSSVQYSSQSGSPAPSFHDATHVEMRNQASRMKPSSHCYQQAPTAAGVGAGAAYTAHPEIAPQDDRNINENGSGQSNGYDGNCYPPFGMNQFSRQGGSQPFDSYDARGNERRSQRERHNDGARSKSERYTDQRKPLGSQRAERTPTSNGRNEDQCHSQYDRNGLSDRATANGRRDHGCYSGQYSRNGGSR